MAEREACLRSALRQSDARLNRTFADFLKQAGADVKHRLRTDELAWIATRDKRCKNDLTQTLRENWIDHAALSPELAWCLIDMTDQRSAWLRSQSPKSLKSSQDQWDGFRLAYARNTELCGYVGEKIANVPEYRLWPQPDSKNGYKDTFGTLEWRQVNVPPGYGGNGWVTQADVDNSGRRVTLLNEWFDSPHYGNPVNKIRIFPTGTSAEDLSTTKPYRDNAVGEMNLNGHAYCLDKCIDEAECRTVPPALIDEGIHRTEGQFPAEWCPVGDAIVEVFEYANRNYAVIYMPSWPVMEWAIVGEFRGRTLVNIDRKPGSEPSVNAHAFDEVCYFQRLTGRRWARDVDEFTQHFYFGPTE